MNVAVIGGGAAGFFAALSCKYHHPKASVTIYEKSSSVLSKVKVSGGGRCNVTNASASISQLVKGYPRGTKFLKKLFYEFNNQHTIEWFEKRGVALKTEPDGRMFPVTNKSQTIIDCLHNEAEKLGVRIELNALITSISANNNGFELGLKRDSNIEADKVIIATGGSAKDRDFEWLKDLGHAIEKSVPSLFTFNMPDESVKELMGVSVKNASVKIQGTKLKSDGPLMITHWGMSGPAILKLSAWGARELSDIGYEFKAQVNWIPSISETEIREKVQLGKQQIGTKNPFELPNRLWHYLIDKIDIQPTAIWQNVGKKGLNRIVNVLQNDVYQVKGKTTFKEEFVTCGGVSLSSINGKNLESKTQSGLYFTGEVLDVDGITGGYNFQAAWTTGFIAGQLL